MLLKHIAVLGKFGIGRGGSLSLLNGQPLANGLHLPRGPASALIIRCRFYGSRQQSVAASASLPFASAASALSTSNPA